MSLYIYPKSAMKETYKRNLQKRPIKETSTHVQAHTEAIEFPKGLFQFFWKRNAIFVCKKSFTSADRVL